MASIGSKAGTEIHSWQVWERPEADAYMLRNPCKKAFSDLAINMMSWEIKKIEVSSLDDFIPIRFWRILLELNRLPFLLESPNLP